MDNLNYKCPKCGNTAYKVGEIRASGSYWGKLFEVEGRRFSTVTCENCHYTEFYEADTSMLGNIFDLFVH
ncbi:MAG: zinc ribbon domain-containing protein [Candidatus Wallbacteria bacterium]|nr:zinc ribbon domain-containing protein [Candidatus Wallbacteria bacterium]